MDEPEDPGYDRYTWETEWADLQPALADDPREALPAVVDLISRMLEESGHALEDPVAAGGEDPELVSEYAEARRVSDLISSGADVDPGDIGATIEDLRGLYEQLMAEGEADGFPGG